MTADDPLLELLASRAYRRGQFTLASGRSSEHYVNCKPVTLSGRELDALIVRKEAKGHGTGAWLEGPLPEPGSRITLLEDVVTSGGSALKAVTQLRSAGYELQRVVAIVDREEGGAAALAAEGLELQALYQLSAVAAQHLKS